jgi:high-affinity K+ transport system ATPase subunit B
MDTYMKVLNVLNLKQTYNQIISAALENETIIGILFVVCGIKWKDRDL